MSDLKKFSQNRTKCHHLKFGFSLYRNDESNYFFVNFVKHDGPVLLMYFKINIKLFYFFVNKKFLFNQKKMNIVNHRIYRLYQNIFFEIDVQYFSTFDINNIIYGQNKKILNYMCTSVIIFLFLHDKINSPQNAYETLCFLQLFFPIPISILQRSCATAHGFFNY